MGENDVTLGRVSDSIASAHKRIDKLESEMKDQRALTLAVAKLDSKFDNLAVDVGEVKTEVKQISSRPVKWWDRLIYAAVGAVSSGIVAAILTQILK